MSTPDTLDLKKQVPPAQKEKLSKKFVFAFKEGDGKNKQLLGGKGANLCEMTQIGLNVPPGFVISTEACLTYLANDDHALPPGVITQVNEHMKEVELASGKSLVILKTLYWFLFVPVQLYQCPA